MGLETEVLRVAFSFFVSLPCMSLGYIKLRLSDCVFESIILELELWTEALCCLACLCRWNINVLHRGYVFYSCRLTCLTYTCVFLLLIFLIKVWLTSIPVGLQKLNCSRGKPGAVPHIRKNSLTHGSDFPSNIFRTIQTKKVKLHLVVKDNYLSWWESWWHRIRSQCYSFFRVS